MSEMDERRKRCGDVLMTMCPEMLKPFAEMYLSSALAAVPDDELTRLDNALTDIRNMPDDESQAKALMELGSSLGGDFSQASAFLELVGGGTV